MKIEIHKLAEIQGGHEYFYSVFDDQGNVIKGNQFAFAGREKPSTTKVEEWKTQIIARVKEELEEEPETPPEMMEVSSVDQELISTKYAVKDIALAEMKADNTVTVAEIQSKVTDKLGATAGKLAPGLVDVYVKEAYDRKYIEENTYDALKVFVSGKPIKDLKEIK